MKHYLDSLDPQIRSMADRAAFATAIVGGFLADNISVIALSLTAVWTVIRIWETDTVRKLTGRSEKDDG